MTLQPFDPADYVTVTVTSLPAVTVVEVSGEIDMATRDAMADPLFAQLDNAPPGVVLDLTKIDFRTGCRCRAGRVVPVGITADTAHIVLLPAVTLTETPRKPVPLNPCG